MKKRIATLASLVCMVAAGCRGGTPTGASVPDRPLYDGGVGMIGGGRSAGIGPGGPPRFDGGWVGPGGRSAIDSIRVNTTDTATCSEERVGGWVGPGGRVVDPCATTSPGQ